MVLQLGSIYDGSMEKRGWIDPTPLFENVDRVVVADVYNFKPNFDFAADYLRSICDFWNVTQNKKVPFTFSTETNWPGYRTGSDATTPATLCDDWKEQTKKYFDRGAGLLSIFGWGETNGLLDPNVTKNYSAWKAVLLDYSSKPILSILNTKAVHLGAERFAYTRNYFEADGWYWTFEIYKSLKAQKPYQSNTYNYDGNCDIVTNYMFEKNPAYINRYSNGLWFTKSSEYITDAAYLSLMSNIITVRMDNATWYRDNAYSKYAFTRGLKNEYNEIRSP